MKEKTGSIETITVSQYEDSSFMYTIENTVAIYSKLFSLLRKEVRRRRRSITSKIGKLIEMTISLIEK
ncbi:MAG TPA: hypothetical protein ENG45_01205 [Candidatus Aenigmarchaeota archaeon]|nr:hypothetical protein [Candidatus Aenigmarchaeota archaeon]